MPARVQIARARAQGAFADVSGAAIESNLRALAGIRFADADDAVRVPERIKQSPPPRERRFGFLRGSLHADGFDFGPRYDSLVRTPLTEPDRDDDAERFLLDHGGWTREEYDDAVAAVTGGELADLTRSTRQEALSATLTIDEAASWLQVGTGRVTAMLFTGDLSAFVCNDELRFPAWQFTVEPDRPVLDHVARLAKGFGDSMHPASILGFMSTPHTNTSVNGHPVNPVLWLTAGRAVQPLLDMLEMRTRL
jgi:hypothetical protein